MNLHEHCSMSCSRDEADGGTGQAFFSSSAEMVECPLLEVHQILTTYFSSSSQIIFGLTILFWVTAISGFFSYYLF